MVLYLLAAALVWMSSGLAPGLASDDPPAAGPVVGEIRALAVTQPTAEVVARMHQEGWLEADGQLLSALDFPDLYAAIGRTWTPNSVQEGRFAVPNVRTEFQSQPSYENPFGVLTAADLVTSGRDDRPSRTFPHLSYWIFVGRNANKTGVQPVVR